jgi:hypothetical protein
MHRVALIGPRRRAEARGMRMPLPRDLSASPAAVALSRAAATDASWTLPALSPGDGTRQATCSTRDAGALAAAVLNPLTKSASAAAARSAPFTLTTPDAHTSAP